MTEGDLKLEVFFDKVVAVLSPKIEDFHWPNWQCFNGKCSQGAELLTDPSTHACNWKDLLVLSAWFLKHSPEVGEDWKRIAREARFDPDGLHDVMLAIFIGGDGRFAGHPRWRVTLAEARMKNGKALEEFRLRVSRFASAKVTP